MQRPATACRWLRGKRVVGLGSGDGTGTPSPDLPRRASLLRRKRPRWSRELHDRLQERSGQASGQGRVVGLGQNFSRLRRVICQRAKRAMLVPGQEQRELDRTHGTGEEPCPASAPKKRTRALPGVCTTFTSRFGVIGSPWKAMENAWPCRRPTSNQDRAEKPFDRDSRWRSRTHPRTCQPTP